ncbi:MAG: SRPBCC family protein [Phycisphaerales bacterium]
MSVKKEPSGRRSVQVEVEVPGTPEEVWRAIATGPGISSWFVPTRSEERQGGEVISTFGPGMDSPATITVWEPLKRFVAEGNMGGPGSPAVATEWTVEARAGGKCLVRVVHSLFASTDDWDNQLDGLEQGWPAIFRILRRRLETFRGMESSAMQFVTFASDPAAKAWEKLGGELGLLNVAEGQKWSTPASPSGLPRMTGTSMGHGMTPSTVLLVLDAPPGGAPGTAYIGVFPCGGMGMVYMAIYLYGPNAKAAVERDEPIWQKWMDERFPAPPMPQGG